MLDEIRRALAEDIGSGDLTGAAVVPRDARAQAAAYLDLWERLLN